MATLSFVNIEPSESSIHSISLPSVLMATGTRGVPAFTISFKSF